jgi:thiol-disulfide isomerase/thioredoxin
MVPILQEVSEKLGDKIQVVKIDTEKYTSIASRYRIEALPTFIIFKDGKPCYRFVSVEKTMFSISINNLTCANILCFLSPLLPGIQEGALPVDQMIEQIENALADKK